MDKIDVAEKLMNNQKNTKEKKRELCKINDFDNLNEYSFKPCINSYKYSKIE